MKVDNPWTQSQIDALTRLWTTTEFTATEIALKHHKKIGDRTRSSILGKVHRLKLPMRMPENSHPGSRSSISIYRRTRPVEPGKASDRPIMDGMWR